MVRVAAAMSLGAAMLIGCNGAMVPDTPTPATPAPATPAPEPPTPQPEATTVIVDNIAFGTDSISIAAGSEVTFVNQDIVAHTVTHGDGGIALDDALFDRLHPVGEEVAITFDEPGTYPITCTIHPNMNMTVIVD